MIHTLRKQGYSLREIAKISGIDRKTVRKRLKQPELSSIIRNNKKLGKLDEYKPYILKWIGKSDARIPSTAILPEIQRYGYTGSLRILQEFLTNEYRKRIKVEPVVRFETEPGQQAQVDWTTIRSGKDKIYAFVMTLGYSRNSFVWFTNNMESSTLIECHHKAFGYFGGVTKTILYDNMKTVVDKRDVYGKGKHKFHDELLDLSKLYGFTIKLCQPYRAKTKGKVERFNSYLKSNFYRPLQAKLIDTPVTVSVELLNSYIFNWLNMANSRTHGTTGKKPCDLLAEESKYLLEYIKPATPSKVIENNLRTKLNNIPLPIIEQPALQSYDRLVV